MESHSDDKPTSTIMRIRLICCYFGKLPEWIDLWILSCSFSRKISFLIVTDCKYDKPLPPNVNMYETTLMEMKKRFSHLLGFQCVLHQPYKLCDYKPLYAPALPEFTEGYDFVGHCDMDLIWGDMDRYLTDDLLSNYDVVGKYGHMMLYRNNNVVLNYYKLPGALFPYSRVYSTKESYGFDEMTGMCRIFKQNSIPHYVDLPLIDASPYFKRIHVLSHGFVPEIFFWDRGHICRRYIDAKKNLHTEEYAYLHFSGKKIMCECVADNLKSFYITHRSFSQREEALENSTHEVLRKTCFKGYWNDMFGRYALKLGKYRNLLKMSREQLSIKFLIHKDLKSI